MRTTRNKVLLIIALVVVAATFQSIVLAQAASPHVVVNAFRLNVRSGPGVGHGIITVVAGGEVFPVTMLSFDRDWYEVVTGAGTGWVHRKYAVDRGDWSGVPWAGAPKNLGSGTAIPAGAPHLVVNTSYLNARSGPGVGHDILTVLPGGTNLLVTAIDRDGRWYQVQTSAGTGWVNSRYTAIRGNFTDIPRTGMPTASMPITSPQPPVPAGTPHLVVNTAFLNVRSGPGVGHNIIMTVRGGTELAVRSIASDGKWYEVNTSLGAGWVNSNYTVGRGDFSGVTRHVQVNPLSGDTPRAVIGTGRLNIRTGPGIGHSVITDLPWRTTLAVKGVSADRKWFLVEGSFGSGWLRNRYVVFRGDYSQVPVVS